jgi:hypothetical protein
VPVSVEVAVTVVVDVGWSPPGDVDASAECEANSTVKLVAASAMLASPAILARLVIFNAVTLLGCEENRVRGQSGPGRSLLCHRAAMPLVSCFAGHQGAMLSKARHGTGWSAL